MPLACFGSQKQISGFHRASAAQVAGAAVQDTFIYVFLLKSQIYQPLQAADVLDAALLSSVIALNIDYSITRITNSGNVL
jgi:hypothetical protein